MLIYFILHLWSSFLFFNPFIVKTAFSLRFLCRWSYASHVAEFAAARGGATPPIEIMSIGSWSQTAARGEHKFRDIVGILPRLGHRRDVRGMGCPLNRQGRSWEVFNVIITHIGRKIQTGSYRHVISETNLGSAMKCFAESAIQNTR